MNVKVSTTIDRRPSEVFAFVADARNEGRWHTDIIEVSLTGGDGAGAGTTYHVRTKPAMGVSEGAGTVLSTNRTTGPSSSGGWASSAL